jgi:hypothetical protein
MSQGLLALAGAALLSHDGKAPPGIHKLKDVTLTSLQQATNELTKDPEFAYLPVRQALIEAKQACVVPQYILLQNVDTT